MYLVREGFKAGSAGLIIGKFLRVLSRRIKKSITCSPYGIPFQGPLGKFMSYYALFPSGREGIRINFLLGKSDIIHSVDYFDTISDKPAASVLTDGLNVIQILSTLEQLIQGTFQEAIIREARDNTVLHTWLQQNYNDQLLQSTPALRIKDAFEAFCRSNGVPIKTTYYGEIRKYIKARALANPNLVPVAAIGRVDSNPPALTQMVNSTQEAQFSSIQNEANDHLKKYDMLEHYLKIIASNNKKINGLFIAGKAGIGKTASVKPILKALGVKYASYTGNVAGMTGLYGLLWKHSNSDPVDVVIFDDCDTILSNPSVINLLKGAMDSVPVREVDYVKKESVLSEVRGGPVQLTDFLSDGGAEVTGAREKPPSKFIVLPKIIFISNLPDIPAAIGSRCLRIRFDFTEEQTWDLMYANLESILDPSKMASRWDNIQGIEYREITRENAKDVFDFCKELRAGVEAIDFRQIQFALSIYASCRDDSWKNWVRMHFRRI